MNTDFNLFTIAIFIGCDFEQFTKTVIDTYRDTINKGKGRLIENTELNLEQYKDAEYGCHFTHFSWWQSSLYSNIIFVSSNQDDGLDNPCFCFQELLKCTCIKCRMSSSKFGDVNSFVYTNNTGDERVVIALKDDRWSFFQRGEPLPFEDLSLYDKKRIKDRINMDIIFRYLKELGVDFATIDSCVTKCSSYEQLEWG